MEYFHRFPRAAQTLVMVLLASVLLINALSAASCKKEQPGTTAANREKQQLEEKEEPASPGDLFSEEDLKTVDNIFKEEVEILDQYYTEMEKAATPQQAADAMNRYADKLQRNFIKRTSFTYTHQYPDNRVIKIFAKYQKKHLFTYKYPKAAVKKAGEWLKLSPKHPIIGPAHRRLFEIQKVVFWNNFRRMD